MTEPYMSLVVCLVLLLVCLYAGLVVQWVTERESAPVREDQWDPRGGPCERCGGRTAVQYGVSVWFAETRRDGEATYDSSHRWCSHCREQVEAEIDDIAERVRV